LIDLFSILDRHTKNAHIPTHCWNINLPNIFCLIIKNLIPTKKNISKSFSSQNFTSDGEANVKTISAADAEVGAGAVEVA